MAASAPPNVLAYEFLTVLPPEAIVFILFIAFKLLDYYCIKLGPRRGATFACPVNPAMAALATVAA